METFYLIPSGQKSFYGKCHVRVEKGVSTLVSYETEVATYDHKTKKMEVHGWYSATTARHINAFLKYYGFPTATKKEMENWGKD